MAYPKETKRAAQQAYHEARAFGHSKEEARQIRDNWKTPTTISSNQEDEDHCYIEDSEPYSRDCIDD